MFVSIRLLAPKQKQMGYKAGGFRKKKSLKKENFGVFLEYCHNFLQRNISAQGYISLCGTAKEVLTNFPKKIPVTSGLTDTCLYYRFLSSAVAIDITH